MVNFAVNKDFLPIFNPLGGISSGYVPCLVHVSQINGGAALITGVVNGTVGPGLSYEAEQFGFKEFLAVVDITGGFGAAGDNALPSDISAGVTSAVSSINAAGQLNLVTIGAGPTPVSFSAIVLL